MAVGPNSRTPGRGPKLKGAQEKFREGGYRLAPNFSLGKIKFVNAEKSIKFKSINENGSRSMITVIAFYFNRKLDR